MLVLVLVFRREEGRKRPFCFHTSGFIEEFLGEDVLGDEYNGGAESADNTEDVSGELDRAGEDDAEGEGDEGEVGGCCVADVEYETVGEDCEERGKAFDGVDEGDGDLLRGGGGEDVPAYLEDGEGKGGANNMAGGVADAVFEDWDGLLEGRDKAGEEGEDDAPRGDAGELDDGEGDGLGEGVEDCFGGRVCEGGAHVPDKAEDLRTSSAGWMANGEQERYNKFERKRSLQCICNLSSVGSDAAFPRPDGPDSLADTLLPSMLGGCAGDVAVAPSDMAIFPCMPSIQCVAWSAIRTRIRLGTGYPSDDVSPARLLLVGREIFSRGCRLQVGESDGLGLVGGR